MANGFGQSFSTTFLDSLAEQHRQAADVAASLLRQQSEQLQERRADISEKGAERRFQLSEEGQNRRLQQTLEHEKATSERAADREKSQSERAQSKAESDEFRDAIKNFKNFPSNAAFLAAVPEKRRLEAQQLMFQPFQDLHKELTDKYNDEMAGWQKEHGGQAAGGSAQAAGPGVSWGPMGFPSVTKQAAPPTAGQEPPPPPPKHPGAPPSMAQWLMSTPKTADELRKEIKDQADIEHRKRLDDFQEKRLEYHKGEIDKKYNLQGELNQARVKRMEAQSRIEDIRAKSDSIKAKAAMVRAGAAVTAANRPRALNGPEEMERRVYIHQYTTERAKALNEKNKLIGLNTRMENDYKDALRQVRIFLPGYNPDDPEQHDRLKYIKIANDPDHPNAPPKAILARNIDAIKKLDAYDEKRNSLTEHIREWDEDIKRIDTEQKALFVQGEGRTAHSGGPARGQNYGSADVARIKGQSDYDSLPSGAVFMGPDGKKRRKP